MRVLVSQYVIATRPPGIMLRVLQVDALKEDNLFVHVLLREVGREHTKEFRWLVVFDYLVFLGLYLVILHRCII